MSVENSYDMSACQQHIWEGIRFRETDSPGHSSNNLYFAGLFTGQLDLLRLTDAAQHLTDIHDVLRMRLSDSDEMPSLVVAGSARAPITFIDMSAGPGDIAQVTYLSRTIVSALAGQTFDLVAGPLWSCAIIRLAADRHIICLVFNHLLVDGTSALKLGRQLMTVYSGGEITPRPASYAQFAGRVYPADTSQFWMSETTAAGYPGVAVEAPEGNSGPQTVAWRSYPVKFGDDVPILTNGATRTYRWTPYVVHAAAYCASLAEVFGRSSFVVATSVYRGDLAPTPTSVGCYLDIVYFLYRDAPEASVRELVDGVRDAFLRGFQNLSLKRSIIADIKFAGDVSKVPPGIFFHDVWIGGPSDGNPGPLTTSPGGLAVEEIPRPADSSCRFITTPYQVWLYSRKLMPSLWLNTANGSSVYIKANASVHPNGLVQRISGTYRNILQAMDDPRIPLHDARQFAGAMR